MAGNVWKVEVGVGAQVSAGQVLIILESMKMEIPVESPESGRVLEVRVAPEDPVDEGQILVVLEI